MGENQENVVKKTQTTKKTSERRIKCKVYRNKY